LAFRREVRRAVRERGCDAVLVHMVPKYAVLARRLAVPRRIPIYLWYTHSGVNPWLRWSEPLVEKIFTASQESLTIETHKKVVTRHGIDVGFLRPEPAEAPVAGKLVTVGRFTPSKDVEFLLRATAALRASGVAATLDVVGDGLVPSDAEYRERMLALRRELGLEEAARFTGAVPYREIPPVYRRGALFASASRTGSVDKAVLEAMACGVPVLTSNASFRAILPPEHLFAERDAADFVAKAKNLLSWDPARRAREGARLRAIVERDHAVAPLMDRLVSEMAPRAAAVGGAR
jgi:glycosyltransferase involved in cell wall biosynthesis